MSSLSVSLNIDQRMVIQYCHSTIFLLGTIGSLINICLFLRPSLRSNSCCICEELNKKAIQSVTLFCFSVLDFLASSVNALILLSIGIVPQLYALYNSPNPFTTISIFCKARSYLNQTSAMSCRWLLIVACIDRCISCSTSARIRRFSSVMIARKLVLIIISIWLILPIHMIIFSDIQPPGNVACSVTNNDVAIYHRFYTIIMGGVLPTIISLICTLFIWQHFQQRRRRRLIRIFNNEIDRKKRIRDQQVVFMLLIQVAILIISTIPFMTFNIYDTMTHSITNKSIDRKAIEAFLKTLTELLVYLITMSFYSNTLASSTFRKELITIFKLIINCRRQQYRRRVGPSVDLIRKTNTIPITTMTMRIVKTSMPEIAQTA